jgi:hypothetical protein
MKISLLASFLLILTGKIFSCFMASCLLGSTAFGALQKNGISTERIALGMIITAASAMSVATAAVRKPYFTNLCTRCTIL